jgi:protease-4
MSVCEVRNLKRKGSDDMNTKTKFFLIITITLLYTIGCAAPNIKLFPDASDPLREFTLQGTDKGKLLIIPVSGIISDVAKKGMFRVKPSMVQEIVSHLRLAEKDDEVRAILLKIDSPGGSTTASDILYHEVMAFKKRTGAKVVAVMMDLATSGGYYISLPADSIIAHPTTITGSIGVIFIRPKLTGLMEKIGLGVEVNKSGENKDMGSPFRAATKDEKMILQHLTDTLGQRFIHLVGKHRNLDQKTLKEISSARIYIAEDARQLGLIDKVGYLSDAVSTAKSMAGLSDDAKVVVYRRIQNPNDNLYNTSTIQSGGTGMSLVDLGLPETLTSLRTGFYYLWSPAAGEK